MGQKAIEAWRQQWALGQGGWKGEVSIWGLEDKGKPHSRARERQMGVKEEDPFQKRGESGRWCVYVCVFPKEKTIRKQWRERGGGGRRLYNLSVNQAGGGQASITEHASCNERKQKGWGKEGEGLPPKEGCCFCAWGRDVQSISFSRSLSLFLVSVCFQLASPMRFQASFFTGSPWPAVRGVSLQTIKGTCG